MRLPLIRHINAFVKENDEDYIEEAMELLEYLTESPNLKDEELDVIGELLSNLQGSLEVQKLMKTGVPEKEANNLFMKRVMGSIDQ